MATLIGNVLALLAVLVAAGFGIISFTASAIAYVVVAYGGWLFVTAMDLLMRPNALESSLLLLPDNATKAYRKYHMSIRISGAAVAYSALINDLRLAGIIWGSIGIWKEHYWLGGAAIFFYFFSGNLILRLNPWLYMSAQAQKGNPVAIEQLCLIEMASQRYQGVNDQGRNLTNGST